MNNFAAYTPLESLLLFQALLSHGVEPAAFVQVSNLLKNNALIKDDDTYDVERLSPEALRELFLHLLRQEVFNEPGADVAERGLSPNSKKRKLQVAPLPTLREVQNHIEKLPALVDRLYARYRDHVIREVREDERRIAELQKEIAELERLEREEERRRELAQRAVTKNGTANLDAPRDVKVQNGPAKSPVQTPIPVPVLVKPAAGQTPQVPGERRDVVPPSAAVPQPSGPSPTHISPVPASVKSQQPPLKAPNGPAPVLQPPIGVSQPPPHAAPSSTPVPLPTISPRPEGTAKVKPPSTAQPAQAAPTPGALKWEKPYQPPTATPPQGRPVQPPPNVPPGGLVPTPGQPQNPQSWHPQHPSQHATQPQPPTQPSQPPRYQPQTSQPVLVPPQTAGQLAPPPPPPPHTPSGREPSEASGIQPPSRQPIVPPVRPLAATLKAQSQAAQQPGHTRPVAAAPSSVPAGTPTGQTGSLSQKRAPNLPPAYAQAQFSPSPAASLPQTDGQRHVSTPVSNQSARPLIPAHLVSQVAGSPSPAQRANPADRLPQTPATAIPAFVTTGAGTRWTAEASPSTPRPQVGELPSPAWEPLSPVLVPSILAKKPLEATSTPPPTAAKKFTPKQVQKIDAKPAKLRGRPPRSAQKVRGGSSTPATGTVRRSQSVASQADELAMDHDVTAKIKDEAATPRLHEETGDTTADESGPSRRHVITPGSVTSRLTHKRKRQDSATQSPAPPSTAPTLVLWTRQFGRVSASALDQISSHRSANTFANPIRDRDAPGYKSIILQPQDIKSIRMAISHGNRAATQAAAALPDGDPGTGSVWLPISDELVPPKGIINSAQLEKELVHMFSNAIMYNLDPNRGPGPAFMKGRTAEDGGDVLGYQVDENAVVRDTRLMFVEVEKLLGDLRSAERERTGPQPSNANTRPASVATGTGDDSAAPEDDVDELAGDADMPSTSKRRRTGTRS